MATAVLKALAAHLPDPVRDDQLLALAKRIGQNRVVAGLHYEHDIDKGAELGEKLAAYFVAQAVPPRPPPAAADFTALQWLWTAALAEHG